MRLSLLSLFLLLQIVIYSQENSCEDISQKLNQVAIKFTKQDIEVTKTLADSLFRLVNDDCQEANMYYLFIIGRYEIKKGNFDEVESRFDKAYKMASDLGIVIFQKDILLQKAIIKTSQENYEDAIALNNEAILLPCPEEDLRCLKTNIKFKINISANHISLGNFEIAINNYLEGIELLNNYDFNDSLYRVAIYNGIGNIYDTEMGDKRASLNSYQQALKFCPNGHRHRYLLYNNIANRYRDLSQIDSARFYLNQTLSGTKVPSYLVVPYQGLGDIEFDKKDYNKAIEYYSLAVEKALASKATSKIYGSKALLGKAYYLNEEFAKAKVLFDEITIHYSSTNTSESNKTQIFKYSLLNDVALKSPETSAQLFEVMESIDSLQSVKRAAALDNSIAKYDKLLLKDSLQQVELLNVAQGLKVKNQRLSISLLSILSLIGLCGAFFFYRNFKKKETEITELVFENDELNALNANLESKLSIALVNLKKSSSNSMILQVGRKKVNVEFKDIKYILAEDFGVRFYLRDKSYWTDKALKDVLKELPIDQFLQIFRSTIIHINEIEQIASSKVILKDGTKLKIGRSFKSAIQNTFNDQNKS